VTGFAVFDVRWEFVVVAHFNIVQPGGSRNRPRG
jgi:hypothetical protein